jgi:hypothetical protein
VKSLSLQQTPQRLPALFVCLGAEDGSLYDVTLKEKLEPVFLELQGFDDFVGSDNSSDLV